MEQQERYNSREKETLSDISILHQVPPKPRPEFFMGEDTRTVNLMKRIPVALQSRFHEIGGGFTSWFSDEKSN